MAKRKSRDRGRQLTSAFRLVCVSGAALVACTSPSNDHPSVSSSAAPTCSRQWLEMQCSGGCSRAQSCRAGVVTWWVNHRSECEQDPAQAARSVSDGCAECNRLYCPSTSGSDPIDARGAPSGTVYNGYTRLVYAGPSTRCYTIRYERLVPPQVRIRVRFDDTLSGMLTQPGESIDVCATRILLHGDYDSGACCGTAHWSATPFTRAQSAN